MTTKKQKVKEMFIVVAGETPYLGLPEDRGHTNNLPELPTTLREARHLLKVWRDWDAEIGAPDDPPQDFRIYSLTEVK